MRTDHSTENAVRLSNYFNLSVRSNKDNVDTVERTYDNSEGHENDLVRREKEETAVKLDLKTLQDIPDDQKTPYEKSEQKRLELLPYSGRDRLDPDQKAMIRELEIIEREVIRHEMAHQAASGNAAGAASYQYTLGPDYRYYVTGGQVSYDLPTSATPEAMLKAFEGLRAASGAASASSGQDSKMAMMAEAKIREIKSSIRLAKGKRAYYKQMIRDKQLRQRHGKKDAS